MVKRSARPGAPRAHPAPVVPTEFVEQANLATYLGLRGDLLFSATAGGARTSMGTAVKLKRAGLKKGVPDVLVFTSIPFHRADPEVQPGSFVGLAIEMKRTEGGRLSVEQVDWHARLRQYGWLVVVAKGWLEAKAAIEQAYGPPKRRC